MHSIYMRSIQRLVSPAEAGPGSSCAASPLHFEEGRRRAEVLTVDLGLCPIRRSGPGLKLQVRNAVFTGRRRTAGLVTNRWPSTASSCLKAPLE